ncbi:unnamed protein product [Arabis nemorensis]|uniref:Piwi domain-containing protein n=1 Tax=Arabis nemorensis TaxID=586526 RepID=A0A565CT69_9BRAS|nr:unnamed protein product [Arabis nemorensis]
MLSHFCFYAEAASLFANPSSTMRESTCQSFFHNERKYFTDIGEGVDCCKGFHSSFRTTQGGLSLNIDISSTMIVHPGPAKSTLKNLRVKVSPSNREYKITGLSEKLCKDQTRSVQLTYPLSTVNLFLYKRSNLVKESRQKPQEKMNVLSRALKNSNYNNDPMLQECGVRIGSDFTQVEGRVLPTPKLKVGSEADLFPNNGRWNFNNKTLVEPARITKWVVVNFSARCNSHKIVSDLIRGGKMKGINIDPPCNVFQEDPKFKEAPAFVRVEKMIEHIKPKLPGKPQFLLCFLAERKSSNVYGPWKRKILVESGIVNQCIAPPANAHVNDQYLTNVLLKINAKLGGLNSVLAIERSRPMPSAMRVPTMIIGMDVSHGSPGQSVVPSIAVVVSSREWQLISKYRACVRTQSPKVEMIDNLFKRISDVDDEGIMRELLLDFESSSRVKPNHVIIFRDGVSESQFNQVLNIELDKMMQACKFYDEKWDPKFTVIIAQKNHHTKFFQTRSPYKNVPPRTIIDNKICHPRNNDFYLCAHAGMIGTIRPTHYHVLYDEIGFSADDLQELVHSLSYVYRRSTTAISVAAPICYAHLAAAQMETVMKFEDMSETISSSHGGMPMDGPVHVPPMPKLHPDVATSMYFCQRKRSVHNSYENSRRL